MHEHGKRRKTGSIIVDSLASEEDQLNGETSTGVICSNDPLSAESEYANTHDTRTQQNGTFNTTSEKQSNLYGNVDEPEQTYDGYYNTGTIHRYDDNSIFNHSLTRCIL